MSDIESGSALSLEADAKSLLESLGLAKVLIREKDNSFREWEPQSIEDAIYYLEREIAAIVDLLRNSAARIAKITKDKVQDQDVVLPGDRPKITVPAGGPSDADLRQKQAALESKLAQLRKFKADSSHSARSSVS